MLRMIGNLFDSWVMPVLLWAIVLALVVGNSGCSIIAPNVGPKLAEAVNGYCAKVSYPERLLLRDSVNSQIAPNAVRVDCAGDPPQ